MSDTLSTGREAGLSDLRDTPNESTPHRLSLIDIYESYGHLTDKLTAHQYPHIYEEIFEPVRHLPVRLLEIGIALGGSISAWQEYFPEGTIYALDIEQELVERVVTIPRVEGFRLDAGNRSQLESWLKHQPTFDFVIDDGSHKVFDIMTSLTMIWPQVTPGGWYFIEDAAQADTPLTLTQKMSVIAQDVVFNDSDAVAVTFWPNLIGLQKRLIGDPRCPVRGTL